MRRLNIFFFVVAAGLAFISCARETERTQALGETVTFTATVPQSRTELGEPEGNVWPNLWSEGDAISVNGVASAPLTAEQAGGSSASFTVEGVSAPYDAVYPATATEIPTLQEYVEGSYDPAAFLMRASSQDASLAFEAEVAIFKFTPMGEGGERITSVSINGYKMEAGEDVELGKPWFVAIAPGDYTQEGIRLIVTDADGGVMLRNATPNKAYEAGKMYSASLAYEPDPELMNVYGTVTCAGEGVPGVPVSDGITIVRTDENGHYAFHSEKKWQNVFVIIPSGYEVPLDGVQPRHYQSLSGDVNELEQADFELIAAPVEDFRLLVLGDIHLARRTGDLDQFSKVTRTIAENMDSAPGKVYVMTLGDHAWDMYWISNNFDLQNYIDTQNSYFGNRGIPFFHTMGNHDNEMEKSGDVDKALTYIHTVAPTYYSFNLGQVHFIVLDNMDFTGVPSGQSHRSEYKKNFTADQLEWLRQDLALVDKSTPIVLTAHEPMAVPDGLGWKEEMDGADADKAAFLAIFDGYDVQMITGHTHSVFNRTHTPTFHEHNYGAVCGTWWWSGYLTPGIHIGQEGSPGGIGVFEFSGKSMTHYFQAAGQDRNYQFRAYDMNKVKEFLTEDYAGGHPDWTKYYNYIQNFESNIIYVNVWDWDEDWQVNIEEEGTPLEVTRLGGNYDPLHIAAFTGPRLKISSHSDSPSFQTRKWNHYFKAKASNATSTVTVRVTDRFGNVYVEEMERPKAFSIEEYRNHAQRTGLVATPINQSSSSLAFKWTQGDSDGDDVTSPYKAALYRDEALTDLVVSFEIPAEASCWDGKGPRFVFGGLTPSTTYWFQVQDTMSGEKSAPISSTTKDFTVVDPATVTNAGVGDVVLAEDFSEIPWGSDMLSTAAGFIPGGKPLEPLSGNITVDEGTYREYDNTAGRIYGEARVTSDKRLYNWGFFGNSSVYSYAGYLRVGIGESTSSPSARTHIVSPALSGIPEGKIATVDVTVTSSRYNSENDVAVFINDHTSLTLVLAPDQKESTNPKFSSSGGKYTGASLTGGYPLNTKTRELTTKTIRIEGVNSNSCLVIGSYEGINGKNRFFLDDVKVEIVALETPPEVTASLGRSSSCSLSFTWTEGVSAADDDSKPWTIALYRDAACTDLVVSHVIPAGHSCWSKVDENTSTPRQPRFVFGGLEPGTDYWFKATDTTEGAEKYSNVVKGTTLPFTRIDASTVSNAGVGDIILAEDFSEVHYGPDEFDTAAGFMPNPRTLEPITGENPDGSFEFYKSTGTRFWGNGFEITEGTRLSHGWGFYGNSAVYSRVGYFRCATTTNNARTHIVTPKLAGIPDGFKATIEVTVTDRMYETNGDVGVFKASNLTMDPTTDTKSAYFGKYTGSGALDKGYALGISTGSWQTKSVIIEDVTNQDQLLIGSLNNVNVSSKSKNRHNFSEITVKIISLDEAGRTVKVSVIGDSISTFKGWCDTTKGGAYYPKSDCDVSSVSDTWWYRLIYNKMAYGIFEKNISAGNTTVVQNTTGDSSAYWYGWDFGTRLQTLGIGDPDVVLIHGGTNDYGHTSWYGTSEELIDGVSMGSSSFPESSSDRLDELFADADAATTVAAADALDGKTFCSAYIRLIKMIQARCGSVKVVCLIGTYLRGGQREAILRIAEHFGEDNVRVADILGAGVSVPMYSNPHPNATGMANMADFVYQEVGDWIDVQ